MTSIQIGIRSLVEFILRRGDLVPVSLSDNSMQEGSRIHRKIQKSRPDSYSAEVPLKTEFDYLDTTYVVSGRADGIDTVDDNRLIEEIKTSDIKFEDLPQSTLDLYWAQAKVYGYILMHDESLDSVDLQLTYVQTPDEKITGTKITYSKAESETFFNSLIDEYKQWLKLRHELDEARITSAHAVPFPFDEYRNGQYEISKVVYKTIMTEKKLFLEAPTGTGKTISTLFPTIKAMGEQLIRRVFYLTAKQSTRRVCEEAISLMADKGLTLKSITLTAKDQISFPKEKDLPPDQNPYFLGYYDRIKPAILDILNHEDQMTKPIIQEYAQKHMVDPFEFSLDVSLFCDVIIGDYNYLFDPKVHLQRFFSVPDKDNCFLIDEAHNLVSRAKEMYSASLSSSPIANLIKLLSKKKEANKPVITKLRSLKRAFNRYSKPVRDDGLASFSQEEEVTNFNKAVAKLNDAIHHWLAKQQPSDTVDEVVNYYLECRSYALINLYYDDTYRTRIIINDDEIIFRQFCIDPANFLRSTMNLGRATILFSATMSPIDYYERVLGNDPESIHYQANSAFAKDNFEIIIQNNIRTTYRDRAANINPICESIMTLVSQKAGHYLIFFPSMKFMETVRERFVSNHPDIHVIFQTSEMDQTARKEFLDEFRDSSAVTVVGFAVLGGIFSEGIDLKHEQLIGVGIVGVGLPMINEESDLVKDYYDEDNHRGFMYAYQLPGFNNVTQAAGRLIRTKTDTGVIVLMDQRFNQTRYRSIFPQQWENVKIASSPEQLKRQIKEFWHKV
ncbi:helicase C-terminal domain-containing protein [Lentilactobacillus sp. Marseille-Q4993]|uniref:helicase C-terminal domain-containing protein n=1 Tax=Lentilactobacillus sp. Marseille-Q4993 TaxID=3039492 RepID=UPI0024BD381E|nr:helicase C-terminal domain-containing protein [Lentilactobacillus sp. Marseille-Q4993]